MNGNGHLWMVHVWPILLGLLSSLWSWGIKRVFTKLRSAAEGSRLFSKRLASPIGKHTNILFFCTAKNKNWPKWVLFHFPPFCINNCLIVLLSKDVIAVHARVSFVWLAMATFSFHGCVFTVFIQNISKCVCLCVWCCRSVWHSMHNQSVMNSAASLTSRSCLCQSWAHTKYHITGTFCMGLVAN